MLSHSWLRLGLSFLIGVGAVCTLIAWGKSAAAHDSLPPGILTPPLAPVLPAVDAPWDLLVSTQATTLTLNLGLHNALVSGATPRPDLVELTLFRDGEIVATATAYPFPDGSGGYLYAATLYNYYGYTPAGGGGGGYFCLVQAGDHLQAEQTATVVSLTVPVLTALADQSATTVYGEAPPTAMLDVYFYAYTDPSAGLHETVTASASGSYTLDLSAQTAMSARDNGFVFYAGASGQVYRRYNVPFLQIGLGSRYVSGIVAPCTYITLSLYEQGNMLYTTPYVYSGDEGDFDTYVAPAVQTGHHVVITAAGQVVSLTAPLLTAAPDPVAERLTGEAPPGVAVRIDLYRGPFTDYWSYWSGPPTGDPGASQTVTAEISSGVYTATFDDLRASDYGAVYVTSSQGHQTYLRFAVPFLRARLGSYFLNGQVGGGESVTITVIGRSGLVRDVRSPYVYENGYFCDADEWEYGGLRLSTGDRVSATTSSGEVMALTMPTLTAQTDVVNNLVYGQAPPSSPLRVSLSPAVYDPKGGGWPCPDYDYPYGLSLTSTASGLYTAHWNSLVTMSIGDEGAVFYTNPDGYQVVREYSVPYIQANVGGDEVSGVIHGIGQVEVTLRNAASQVKATATDYNYYGWTTFGVSLYPVVIEAGDTIEVATAEQVMLAQVPALSLVADWEADTITGQAPPNASAALACQGNGCGSQNWTITATAAGTFHLDLSGQVDIARGDDLTLTYTDPDGNQFWTWQRIAQLQATLHSNQVSVGGPTNAALTLTLLAPGGSPLYTTTSQLDSNGWTTLYLYDPTSWSPLFLEPGQTITTTVDGESFEMTLPLLTAQTDVDDDTVSGLAPPGAVLQVVVDWQTSYITATAAGAYTLYLSSVQDIGAGSSGRVNYWDAEGNEVLVIFGAPHLSLTLGDSLVSGVAPGGAPLTVTLYDAFGDFKGSDVEVWANYGQFSAWLVDEHGSPVPIASGDRIVVQSPGGEMSFIVPALSAAFDHETKVLSGVAPAAGWLAVDLAGAHRRVQAGSDGAYAMDWADLSPAPGAWGTVNYVDGYSNVVKVPFQVPYYQAYLPVLYLDAPGNLW